MTHGGISRPPPPQPFFFPQEFVSSLESQHFPPASHVSIPVPFLLRSFIRSQTHISLLFLTGPFFHPPILWLFFPRFNSPPNQGSEKIAFPPPASLLVFLFLSLFPSPLLNFVTWFYLSHIFKPDKMIHFHFSSIF